MSSPLHETWGTLRYLAHTLHQQGDGDTFICWPNGLCQIVGLSLLSRPAANDNTMRTK